MRWIDRGFAALVYGTAFALLANQIISLIALSSGARDQRFTNDLPAWFRALAVLSVIAALTLHFRRVFQTLALSANSIARERNANNWDMLVLTGIDARKIVLGKWWATVRHMWRPYVMLGILRAVLMVWYGAYINWNYYGYAAYGGYNDANTAGIIVPMLLQLMLAGAAVFILTIVNLLFTAACGVSAFNKRSGVALARAVATRLFLVIGLALLGLLLVRFWLNYSYPNVLPSIFVLSLLTIFDNGVTVVTNLATYNFYGNYAYYGSNINPVFAVYLPAAILGLLIYALLTFLLLRLAQWQAVRQGATPPLRRPLIKIV